MYDSEAIYMSARLHCTLDYIVLCVVMGTGMVLGIASFLLFVLY